jgi:hypothetical protein
MPINNLITVRKGTEAEWYSSAAILANGEPGLDTTNGIFKIGDGVSTWENLLNHGVFSDLESQNVAVYSSVSGATLLTVEGTNGSLFSVVDNLSGTLMSVNNNAGLPVFEVFSDDSIVGGRFGQNDWVISSSGNIGIGVADPAYKVSVSGNVNVSGNVIAETGIVNQIVFNTGLADPDLLAGQLQWNNTEGTLDLGLNDSYAMHLGEEMLYRIRNTTGSTLLAGQPVYASGLSAGGNNRIEVNLYVADGSIREVRFMGLITEDLADAGNNGYATHFGYIRGVDTRGDAATYGTTNKLWDTGEPAWNEGDILYVHPTTPGKLTKIEPKHSISVAIVTNKASNGKLFVRPTTYGHLDDNHDVNVSGVTNGQFLQYDSATDYWVPSSSGNFTNLNINGNQIPIGSGLANHIAYWNSSSGLVADSGQLYWDSSNNRLGIGIDNPTSKLEVGGSARVSGVLSLYDDGVSAWKNITAASNNLTFDGVHGIFGFSIGLRGSRGSACGMESNATNGYLALAAGGSERVRIATDGKVGIGTTSPSHSFHVSGSGLVTNGFYTNHINVNNSVLTSANGALVVNGVITTQGSSVRGSDFSIYGDNNTRIYKPNGSTLASSVSNSEYKHSFGFNSLGTHYDWATINSTGLGIGTTSPTTALDVSGVITATGGNSTDWNTAFGWGNHAIAGYAPLNSPTFTGTPSAPTAASGTNTTQIATTAFVRTEITNLVDSAPGTLDTLNELAAALGDDPNFATTVTNNLATKVAGTGTTNKIPKWGSSSALTDSIITEASSVLQIAGSIQGAIDNNYLSFDANANRVGITKKGGFFSKFTYGSSAEFAIAQSNSTDILPTGTFTDRFIITSNGTIRFPGLTSNGFLKTGSSNGTLSVDTTSYQPLLTNPVTGSGTTNYVSKWTSSSSQGNSIISDDGVTCAIGTAGGTRVQIAGIGGANAVSEYFSTQSNPRWQIGRDLLGGGLAGIGFGIGTSTIAAGGVAIGYAASREMGFYTSNGSSLVERMRIDDAGNIGIGTSNPTVKLDIEGKGKFGEPGYYVYIGNDNLGSDLGISTATEYIAVKMSDGKFRYGGDGGSNIGIVIDSTYKVGIGTDSPEYKLQVNGSFGATTKSFRIDHPSKPNYSLEYGSLESPYHGVRLTGRGKITRGIGVVELPFYLKDLIHNDDTINIQLTNYKHGKTLYVSDIDLTNDRFTVKADRAKTLGDLEFFWTLTGVRKDVDHLVVEKEKI